MARSRRQKAADRSAERRAYIASLVKDGYHHYAVARATAAVQSELKKLLMARPKDWEAIAEEVIAELLGLADDLPAYKPKRKKQEVNTDAAEHRAG